jgi:uncharacterized protein YlxW (UPF0749 family)
MDLSVLVQPQVASLFPVVATIIVMAVLGIGAIAVATVQFLSKVQAMISASAKVHEEADETRHMAIKEEFKDMQRELREFAGRFRELETRTARIEGKLGIHDPPKSHGGA